MGGSTFATNIEIFRTATEDRVSFRTGATTRTFTWTTAVSTPGNFYRLTLVSDGTNITASINGVPADAPMGALDFTGFTTIGERMANVHGNVGVSRIRYWADNTRSSLIHDWRVTSGTTTTLVDSGSAGNNGTISGATVTLPSGRFYVKYPLFSLVSDNVIEVHTDGTSADYAVGATYGRNSVFSGKFEAVYLFQNDGLDATGNYDLNTVSAVDYVDAPDGSRAISLQASEIYTAAIPSHQPSTVSFQIYATVQNNVSANHVVLAIDRGNSNTQSVSIGWGGTAFDGTVNGEARILSGGTDEQGFGPDTMTFGVWEHISATFNGVSPTAVQGYWGGLPSGSVASLTQVMPTSIQNITVGGSAPTSATAYGNSIIAEARYSTEVLSDAWVADDYSNRITPASFYTVSAVVGGSTTPVLSAPIVSSITFESVVPNVTVTF
jgi:hypothetical protein